MPTILAESTILSKRFQWPEVVVNMSLLQKGPPPANIQARCYQVSVRLPGSTYISHLTAYIERPVSSRGRETLD